jgi:CheY-like chemotaxis protein
MGDPARLQQVFWNLLKNAVKFTPAGGKITVRSRDGAEDGTVELEVEDTGIGFTPEAADRLFMPFEQATPSGDHQFGGLGLGLAIARAIVDLHGGRITAHSEGHGKGALFRVVLPQASVPPEPKTAPADGRGAGSVTSAPLQILLVEDHDLTRKALAHLLIRSGNQVSATGSLAEAIAAVETQTFDVVISDLGLPDGSGFDLMPQLRERSQHLTGIALSGYGMEEDLQRSSEAGFVAHLVKPIRFEQLTQVLRQVRRQRQEEPVP